MSASRMTRSRFSRCLRRSLPVCATSVVLFALAGCAPMQWVKPETGSEQMQKDAAECRDAAWREASRYYWPAPWGYPAYGYGFYPYYPRARFYGPPGLYYHDRFYEEERLAQFCMQAKGYRLQPVERSSKE